MDYVEIELEELTVEEIEELFYNGELDAVDMIALSYNINTNLDYFNEKENEQCYVQCSR
jgi:hypothetical protein